MKLDQSGLVRTTGWVLLAGGALLAATQALAQSQSQLGATAQSGLRPPSTASTSNAPPSAMSGRLGAPAAGLGVAASAPMPNMIGQATKAPSSGSGAADGFSVRVLTKTEAASSASKLLVAKAQLGEHAQQAGGKTDASIANLQTGDSVKLDLRTPRQAWANLMVERPDKIDFDAGTLEFDASVTRPNYLPGNPACKFTVPSEGYYMVDMQIDMSQAQQITTFATPHQAEDHRAKVVQQQVPGGPTHILVTLQAGKPPNYSMVHTVQVWGSLRYTFINCEITRLK